MEAYKLALCGTARLLSILLVADRVFESHAPVNTDGELSLGRVVLDPDCRGRKWGTTLVDQGSTRAAPDNGVSSRGEHRSTVDHFAEHKYN